MSDNCLICSTKCMGFSGNKGGCCTVADRDYIIGHHGDDRINKKWCLEQSILRTVKDGKHSSLVGFGLKYHL